MSFYSNLKSTADRLISKYGVAPHTFTKTTKGAYDPATRTTTDTTSTPSTYSVYGVKSEYSAFEKQNAAIQDGDIKMIAQSANYGIGDTVSIGSLVYRIQDLKPIEPGSTNLAYEIQLRR